MSHTLRPHLLSAALVALAASTALAASAQGPAPAAGDMPKALPHFDPSAVDRSVQPCDDFYQFACGPWMAKNPVPADRSRWGRLSELSERNQYDLRDLLDKVSKNAPNRSPIDQKIGDYYASCMDEAAIEAKGLAPLKPRLDRIAALKSKREVGAELARLQADGVSALFRFGSRPGFKNASVDVAALDEGGLSLPDRDYYLKDEARFADVRKQFPVHVQKMLELAGEPKEAAARDAQTVLAIETELAKVSLDRVKRRDPANIDHTMTRKELMALATGFDWDAYFKAAGTPEFATLNVAWPDFFKGMNQLLEARSLDDWKTYLRWQTLHDAAPLLPTAFVNEDFEFFDKTLSGIKEVRPRWKRCVEFTDRQLGEALGQRYVEATFGPEGKERMSKMVIALETALDADIRDLTWMTDVTKKRALEKRAAIANKIGYPDHWRDYSRVNIVRGDALGNSERAAEFEDARELGKIGRKVDTSEWHMTPPTVNAGYNPYENNVNFPAGILQPPSSTGPWTTPPTSEPSAP